MKKIVRVVGILFFVSLSMDAGFCKGQIDTGGKILWGAGPHPFDLSSIATWAKGDASPQGSTQGMRPSSGRVAECFRRLSRVASLEAVSQDAGSPSYYPDVPLSFKYQFLQDLLNRRPPDVGRLKRLARLALCLTCASVVSLLTTYLVEQWCGSAEREQRREAARRRQAFLQAYRGVFARAQEYCDEVEEMLERGGREEPPPLGARINVNLAVPRFVTSGQLDQRLAASADEAQGCGSSLTLRAVGVCVSSFGVTLGLTLYLTRRREAYFQDTLTYAVANWPRYKPFIPEEFYEMFEVLYERYEMKGGELGLSEEEAREVCAVMEERVIGWKEKSPGF